MSKSGRFWWSVAPTECRGRVRRSSATKATAPDGVASGAVDSPEIRRHETPLRRVVSVHAIGRGIKFAIDLIACELGERLGVRAVDIRKKRVPTIHERLEL